MLNIAKQNTLKELIAGASVEELIWINGYLAGLLSMEAPAENKSVAAPVTPVRITIAYGTETGNSKSLATKLAGIAKQQQVAAKVVSLDQYRLSDLQKEAWFFLVVSTQGDGEHPAAAQKFFDYLKTADVSLNHIKYAVIALGDTAYPLFCQAGIDVDSYLEQKGGNRIIPVVKCDTDYEADAVSWFAKALQSVTAGSTASQAAVRAAVKPVKDIVGVVLSNTNLNDRGAAKQTHHIEIAAEGIVYEPGDSLSIVPGNPEQLVQDVLLALDISGETPVGYKGKSSNAYDLLKHRLNITWLPERVVARYAVLTGQHIPAVKISFPDLLRIYAAEKNTDMEELLNILEPISPRLYSISSAPAYHTDEVHLTVSRCGFHIEGEQRYGLCSDFLSRLTEGSSLSFRVHSNKQFRLPAPDKDIIMIGPGTGIAPFRSFLAEREATQADGRNWLFFGEQHFTTDFLYQTEIQNWLEHGVLTNVSLAFSRDQEEKIYVQHKMKQQGSTLFEWLEAGAYVYVCGSRDPMSRDVRSALLEIIRLHGDFTPDEATGYFEKLLSEDRYKEDVY